MKTAFALVVLLSTAVLAQTAPTDSPASPEVHRDRHVTFRIRAPKASEVTIFGDWMPIGSQEKLAKDEQGVWSITLGPLAAGSAIYNFYVDGLAIADPINPRIKLRAKTSASIVDVPGDGTELWQHTDVPHGLVEINWEKSKVIHGET